MGRSPQMKIDPYCQRRYCSPLNALFSDVYVMLILQGVHPLWGIKQVRGGEKRAIFALSVSISLARWRWRLLYYFKQVVCLSATCFHVELEQFSAWFRVARVCQRQLGFLVIGKLGLVLAIDYLPPNLKCVPTTDVGANIYRCMTSRDLKLNTVQQ